MLHIFTVILVILAKVRRSHKARKNTRQNIWAPGIKPGSPRQNVFVINLRKTKCPEGTTHTSVEYAQFYLGSKENFSKTGPS